MGATIIGFMVGLLIGAGCRYFDIPSPAPPRLIGACLLVAMTLGFVAADYLLSRGQTLWFGIVMKSILGLTLAFAIGFACRTFAIPSPAPLAIVGALLVVAMTTGYLLVDRLMTQPARHAVNCGGPSGLLPSATAASALTPGPLPSTFPDLEVRLAGIVISITAHPVIRLIALPGLCAAYLQGGLDKLLDFAGAVAEAQHFGLPGAPVIAVATIVTELVGSVLILSGFCRWIGALWLAGFTLVATFVANRFWAGERASNDYCLFHRARELSLDL